MTVDTKPNALEDDYEEYDEFDEEENERGLSGLVVLLMGLVMLGAFASVVWIAYQQGLKNGNPAAPPTIVADPEPVKIENDIADAASAGDQRSVYDSLDGTAEPAEVIAAGPEEPIDRGTDSPLAAAAEPAPHGDNSAPLIDDAAADRIAELAAADAALEEAPPAPTPEPAPVQPAPQPATMVAAATDALSGSHVVQVGAFKSAAEAASNWASLQRRLGDFVSGKTDDVERADLGERGVFYRLRIGPFASSGDAKTYCEGLKSRGQDCIVRAK